MSLDPDIYNIVGLFGAILVAAIVGAFLMNLMTTC